MERVFKKFNLVEPPTSTTSSDGVSEQEVRTPSRGGELHCVARDFI